MGGRFIRMYVCMCMYIMWYGTYECSVCACVVCMYVCMYVSVYSSGGDIDMVVVVVVVIWI